MARINFVTAVTYASMIMLLFAHWTHRPGWMQLIWAMLLLFASLALLHQSIAAPRSKRNSDSNESKKE